MYHYPNLIKYEILTILRTSCSVIFLIHKSFSLFFFFRHKLRVSTNEIFSDSSAVAVLEEQSAKLKVDILLDIDSGKKPLKSNSNGEIYSFDMSCTLSSADR